MTKRLFDRAQHATLDEQLALEARAPDGGDEDGGLRRGRDRVPREAPAELHRPLIRTVDYHTGGRAVPDRHRRRRAARRRARSSTSGATRASTSTTSGACSSTSRAATPTCTAASSPSRRTTAPTSASSSSTTPATRPPAGTGRSRSSPGRSRAGWSRGPEVVVDVPSGRLRDGRPDRGRAASCRCAFGTSPSFVHARGLPGGAAAEVDVAFGGAFYASLAGAGRARRAAAADRARPGDQGRPGGGARDRPPATSPSCATSTA